MIEHSFTILCRKPHKRYCALFSELFFYRIQALFDFAKRFLSTWHLFCRFPAWHLLGLLILSRRWRRKFTSALCTCFLTFLCISRTHIKTIFVGSCFALRVGPFWNLNESRTDFFLFMFCHLSEIARRWRPAFKGFLRLIFKCTFPISRLVFDTTKAGLAHWLLSPCQAFRLWSDWGVVLSWSVATISFHFICTT